MKEETCPECRGGMKRKVVEYVRYGEKIGKFPAWVCNKCGAEYYDEDVIAKMEELVKAKGLWGLESKTKIAEAGNGYAIRLTKRLMEFIKGEKGKEVLIYPENKKRLIVEI